MWSIASTLTTRARRRRMERAVAMTMVMLMGTPILQVRHGVLPRDLAKALCQGICIAKTTIEGQYLGNPHILVINLPDRPQRLPRRSLPAIILPYQKISQMHDGLLCNRDLQQPSPKSYQAKTSLAVVMVPAMGLASRAVRNALKMLTPEAASRPPVARIVVLGIDRPW